MIIQVRDPVSGIVLAVQERLREFFRNGIWHIEIVPDPMTVGEFNRLLGVTPCLALSWLGFKLDEQARDIHATIRFSLTIILKTPQNRDNRFLGTQHKPGLFQVVSAVAAALHGYTLQEFGTISVSDCEQRYAEGASNENLVFATLNFNVQTLFEDILNEAAMDDFLGLLNAPTIEDANEEEDDDG